MESIDDLFKEKKVTIIREDNNIKLILIHSENNVSNSTFVIIKNKDEEGDIIPKLIESHNALIKRVKFLEESNKQMKEISYLIKLWLFLEFLNIFIKLIRNFRME